MDSPAGWESAPVTYTPKSGPLALGDPQAASCRLTLAPSELKPQKEEGTLCPKAPPFLTVSEASDSRIPSPRRLELSATPAGHFPEAKGTAEESASWLGLRTPVPNSPRRGAGPGAPTHTNPPLSVPTFPGG